MPLKLTRRAGSPNWFIRGSVRGEDIFESTGTSDLETAEAIRIKREAEELQISVFGRKAVATFIEAVTIYVDAGGETRFLGKYQEETGKWSGLIGHFGSRKLNTIGQVDLDKAARILLPNATPETRNRQIYTPFIAIWKKAAKRSLCDYREWDRPKMTAKPRSRWATPQEVAAMIAEAAPHLKPLVGFLVLTGARLYEAINLDWADVNLSQAWVVFRNTKRHDEDRGVPLHPSVVVSLANLPHREGKVFRTPAGNPYYDTEKKSGGQIKSAWAGMLKRSGVAEVTPHTLRHTFSTWLTETGISERIRDELMGHASSDTGRRYAHVPRLPLIAAVQLLPKIPDGNTESEQSKTKGDFTIKNQ